MRVTVRQKQGGALRNAGRSGVCRSKTIPTVNRKKWPKSKYLEFKKFRPGPERSSWHTALFELKYPLFKLAPEITPNMIYYAKCLSILPFLGASNS